MKGFIFISDINKINDLSFVRGSIVVYNVSGGGTLCTYFFRLEATDNLIKSIRSNIRIRSGTLKQKRILVVEIDSFTRPDFRFTADEDREGNSDWSVEGFDMANSFLLSGRLLAVE